MHFRGTLPMKILSQAWLPGNHFLKIRSPPTVLNTNIAGIFTISKQEGQMMNENYLNKLKQDMELKNLTTSTMEDYFRFVKRFLEFTGKDAMSVTYADIRKFMFHMKDNECKKASTVNVYTAAIRFFFEYTLGYAWDSKKFQR